MFNEITPLSPASLSSLDSPTSTLKRKQMISPPVKKTELPTAVYFNSATQAAALAHAAGYSHPFLDSPPFRIATGGAAPSSAKKTKTSDNATQPVTAAPAAQSNNYLEQSWANAAERMGTDNAFEHYLASIVPFSHMQSQKQPQLPQQLQQQLPQPQPQPIASKPAPLTKAKRNKEEAKELIAFIHSVNLDDDEDDIYDSCPEVAEKIKQFLLLDGVNRKIFLEDAMEHSESYVMLKSFLEGIDQSQRANKLYGKAYIFFEKLRLVEGRAKSEERLRNEAFYPFGFSTKRRTKKSGAQILPRDLLRDDQFE